MTDPHDKLRSPLLSIQSMAGALREANELRFLHLVGYDLLLKNLLLDVENTILMVENLQNGVETDRETLETPVETPVETPETVEYSKKIQYSVQGVIDEQFDDGIEAENFQEVAEGWKARGYSSIKDTGEAQGVDALDESGGEVVS